MVFHVGVGRMYSTCDPPDRTQTKIKLGIKKYGVALHLLAKERSARQRGYRGGNKRT